MLSLLLLFARLCHNFPNKNTMKLRDRKEKKCEASNNKGKKDCSFFLVGVSFSIPADSNGTVLLCPTMN